MLAGGGGGVVVCLLPVGLQQESPLTVYKELWLRLSRTQTTWRLAAGYIMLATVELIKKSVAKKQLKMF